MKNSQNKLALVTGASRGLGRDIAISLAKKGLDVILTYQSKKSAAEEVVREIQVQGQKAIAIQLDLAEFDKLDLFLSKLTSELRMTFGTEKFDFLINNAGIGINTPFIETTEAQFDILMALQFKSPFFLTQRALHLMNDGGGIVRDNEQVNQHIASLTPLGRVGKPDDIGAVVAFLCTEDARWINGQRIEISGGQQI